MNAPNDPLDFLNEPQTSGPTNRPPLSTGSKLPSPPIPAAKRNEKRGLPVMLIAGAAVVGFVVLALVGKLLFSATSTSADKEAVRTWLRENAHASKWEEVRWWPAKSMDKLRATIFARLQDNAREYRAAIPDVEEHVRKIGGNRQTIADNTAFQERNAQRMEKEAADFSKLPVPRVLRVKFRTLGAFDILHDEYFEIRDGKATPAPDYCRDPAEFPE